MLESFSSLVTDLLVGIGHFKGVFSCPCLAGFGSSGSILNFFVVYLNASVSWIDSEKVRVQLVVQFLDAKGAAHFLASL